VPGGGQDDCRGRADESDPERAVGQGRLLADTYGEVCVRAAEPLGDGPRACLDLSRERLVDVQLDPRGARE
jgi:hypothetical protein